MLRSDGYKNLRLRKKGDKALPGAGRPKGVSIKTILAKLLNGTMIVEEAGKKVRKTRLEVIAAMKVKDAMDPNNRPIDRLRAADSIENRVDGKPEQPISAPPTTPVYITFDKDDAEL